MLNPFLLAPGPTAVPERVLTKQMTRLEGLADV